MNPQDQPENNPNNTPLSPSVQPEINPTAYTGQVQQAPVNNVGVNSYQPQPLSQPKSSKKVIIIVAVVAFVAIALVAVFALGGGDKSDKDSASTASSTESLSSELDDEAPAAAQEQSEVDINKAVSDDIGKTVTVLSLVRNFSDVDTAKESEAVLVKVKTETDGKYSGAPHRSEFRLIADNGEEIRSAYLVTNEDMTNAGFTPFPDASATKTAPAIGYIAYEIPKGTKKITFRYSRAKTKILGGATLEAKNFDVVIVQ